MNNRIIWLGEEIRQALDCSCPDITATGVAIDSRKIKDGNIFIGLAGKNCNGSQFAEQALKNGAALAIVDETYDNKNKNERIIVVPSTKVALWQLAQFARKRSSAIFIAITGSVGKTSVKEMTKVVLAQFGLSYANPGNFNNDYGLPISLCNMPINVQFATFELGMNAPGEIGHLSNLLKPNCAIITRVSSVHQEFFASIADIARAKAEITYGMNANSEIIINADDETYNIISEIAKNKGLKVISFGTKSAADIVLKKINVHEEETRVKVTGKINLEYKLNLVGNHFALNSLAVLGLVDCIGLNIERAVNGLAAFSPLPGRGQIIELPMKKMTIIDETYNSNPTALKAALQRFACIAKKYRKIVMLSDMLELGENAQKMHEEIATDVIANDIDLVFTSGALMNNLYKKLPMKKRGNHYENSEKMAAEIINFIKPNDYILIKGSLSTKMNIVLEKLLA